MEPIYLANMSDSDLQILLGDVQNEIYKREEIMCETALTRLGRAIKEVQESNFSLNLTLASGHDTIKVNDIVNVLSYAYNKTYYINEKELEKASRFPQPKEVKRNEDGTVACIHFYDDVDCYSCEIRNICCGED